MQIKMLPWDWSVRTTAQKSSKHNGASASREAKGKAISAAAVNPSPAMMKKTDKYFEQPAKKKKGATLFQVS